MRIGLTEEREPVIRPALLHEPAIMPSCLRLTRSAMTSAHRELLAGFDDEVLTLLGTPVSDAAGFLVFEQAAERLGERLTDRIIEAKVLAAHMSDAERSVACNEARERLRGTGEARRIDNLGPRPASVRLPGGGVLPLQTPTSGPVARGSSAGRARSAGPMGRGATPSWRGSASGTASRP